MDGGMAMEKGNKGKEAVLAEMLTRYIEMGEEIHKREKELGRLWEDPLKWREEFMAVLRPAGFFVHNVDKIVHPMREIYNVTVMRKLPGEDYL